MSTDSGISNDKLQEFWEWFMENEDRIFHFERHQELIFDELQTAIENIHPDLTFVLSSIREGCREFVISADGIKSAFPAVRQLVKTAPLQSRWQVTAFRPRRTPLDTIVIDGLRVDPTKVEFTLLSSDTEIGIYLYIPGYIEDDSRYEQIGYLMLDQALGEYDVETKLGLIELFPATDDHGNKRLPLPVLPTYFDAVYQRIHGQ